MGIELNKVSFSYSREPATILNKVSFSVSKGEVLAIMGASGSGKSTLLKLITSFLIQDEGSITINRINSSKRKPFTNFGYICQNASDMTYPWLRVEANLLKPLKMRNLLTVESKKYATELLEKFKLTGRKNAFPYDLSGGELKRLSVAMALVYKPDILLLDEPFSGLDLKLAHELWEFMLTYLEQVKPTGILITHNLEEASLLATKVGFLLPDKTIEICDKDRESFVGETSMNAFLNNGYMEYQKYLKGELMRALDEATN